MVHLGRSISIAELRNFAETGETSRQLRWYLNVANLEPERFRAVLTREVTLNLQLVDRITHSVPGEFFLFQLGQIIHTPSRQANIQALRSSLILSVSEDNRLSLLEFMENYPTQGIHVDGVVLARTANRVRGVIDNIEPVVASVEEFLGGLICDCEAPQPTATTQ
ncbi:alpha/beta hydrolase [Egbenema bharatensis]|uniref:alpha/beta hydrolase n=1 Tax=Egbenema bharatensis TaxID=3463334 RepID=UPI003A845886